MTTSAIPPLPPGYSTDEIITNEPTRAARLKWVIVVNDTLPPGQMVNAVACIAASTGALVDGLVAGGGPDASGHHHPGLPWAGCTVLAATTEQLGALLTRAATASNTASDTASDPFLVIDMPSAAQTHRTYDDYLTELAATATTDTAPCALSIVGPRTASTGSPRGSPS